MRLAISEERRQFAESLHEALAAADVPGIARQWAAGEHAPGLALWRHLAKLGVTALAVPERWGGLDAHPIDVVVACEELGHHPVPGPVAESVAAVPALLHAVGGPGDQWLPGLATGDVIATLAAPPSLPYAVDADAVGLLLLVEPAAVRMGVRGSDRGSVDPTRRLFAVSAGGILAAGPAVPGAIARALDLGTLACAAQLLGAGRALLELATGYARQRVQFGRSIGQFQAVKHRLADVAIALEFARPLLHAGAVAFAAGTATAARDVSAAKIACADAAHRAAGAALQIHGAIGYTAEYDLSLWLTKVRALIPTWGTQSTHRARVMVALTEPGAVAWP